MNIIARGANGSGSGTANAQNNTPPPPPPPRVAAGVTLDPRLPAPDAPPGYQPGLVGNGTPNQQNAHINGYRAELEQANRIAALPGETVVRYGSPVTTHGADIISVSADGTVTLWDSKFRSGLTRLPGSATFNLLPNGQPTPALAAALEQAERAVRAANLLPAVEARALQNLTDGNFRAITTGAGNVRNSTPVRFCGNTPCGI